ncbi:uncharacterized protein [Penaeus vannamei]|uniref:uncharacterized protein n=1 Tax=Penaeus vannamei TaxID=6689 RepID=UPI00387F7548
MVILAIDRNIHFKIQKQGYNRIFLGTRMRIKRIHISPFDVEMEFCVTRGRAAEVPLLVPDGERASPPPPAPAAPRCVSERRRRGPSGSRRPREENTTSRGARGRYHRLCQEPGVGGNAAGGQVHVHAGRWRGRSDVLAPRRGRAQQQRLQEGPAPSAAESSDGHERRALAPPLGDSSCRAPAKDSPPTALAPPPSRRTCTAGSGGGFVGRASGGHSTRGYTSLSGSDSPSALRSAAPRASLAAPPAAAKKRVRFSQSVSVSRPPDGVAAPRLPPAPSARAGAPRPAPRLPPSLHRQNLGAIGALAIRERYGDGSDSVYSGLSPRSHALRRHRQSLVAAAAAASASSVAGEYRSLLQGTAPLRPHATPAARALGKAPSAASARRGLGAASARLAAEDEVPVRVKMLSYMLPVEEKVSFAEGDASSFTPLSEDRSPVSETKPLLPADDKPDKLASLEGDLQALESPSTEEVKLIMDEKEKEKTEEPEGEPVEDEDDLEKTPRGLASGGGEGGEGGSPAASEDKSVFSESLASPGSDDRSIIKTTSTKPSLKRFVARVTAWGMFGKIHLSLLYLSIYQSLLTLLLKLLVSLILQRLLGLCGSSEYCKASSIP